MASTYYNDDWCVMIKYLVMHEWLEIAYGIASCVEMAYSILLHCGFNRGKKDGFFRDLSAGGPFFPNKNIYKNGDFLKVHLLFGKSINNRTTRPLRFICFFYFPEKLQIQTIC